MMNLNETLVAYDPAEALADEVGKFELTSPTGEKLTVTCRPGESITSLRVETNGHPQQWQIRKIGNFALGKTAGA